MFTVATRAASGLTATTSPTVPLPFPLAGDATIQFTGLAALHPHPASAVTSTDNRPPVADTVSAPRLNLKVHGAGACDTPTLCEPTTMAPDRAEGTGFGATTKGTAPSP